VTVVTYDQAHFKIDADVRKCWARIGSKPIVYRNGSKEAVNIGGAYMTGKFHFYKMEWQDQKNVLENLKLIKKKFGKIFLILDKARWNKNDLVKAYLEEQKIEYMFFPTGASDLNPVEECWRQTRENVTANITSNSINELYENLGNYWKQQPFTHNVLNYLSP
jgi:putative transposase